MKAADKKVNSMQARRSPAIESSKSLQPTNVNIGSCPLGMCADSDGAAKFFGFQLANV